MYAMQMSMITDLGRPSCCMALYLELE